MNKSKILIVYGTRPEYIKLKPVIDEFKSRNIPIEVACTFQQEDLLEIEKVEYDLGLDDNIPLEYNKFGDYWDGNRLDEITISNLLSANNSIDWKKIKAVMVQGDTATAFSFALAAFHRQKKILHVEAGLRTKNKKLPYPEEFYRRSISLMADVHFCPTIEDRLNLTGEKNSIITGNTVLDTLKDIPIKEGNYVLLTLHRRENQSRLKDWLYSVEASKNKVIWLAHPNTPENILEVFKKRGIIEIRNPVNRDEFVKLLAECRYVITDSGGVQEEANFFKKLTLVCREETERPCSTGVLCENPLKLREKIFIYNSYDTIPKSKFISTFGDGTASKKIVDYVEQNI